MKKWFLGFMILILISIGVMMFVGCESGPDPDKAAIIDILSDTPSTTPSPSLTPTEPKPKQEKIEELPAPITQSDFLSENEAYISWHILDKKAGNAKTQYIVRLFKKKGDGNISSGKVQANKYWSNKLQTDGFVLIEEKKLRADHFSKTWPYGEDLFQFRLFPPPQITEMAITVSRDGKESPHAFSNFKVTSVHGRKGHL